MIFMHNVIHSTCGCSNPMLLSIYIVLSRWWDFGKEDLDSSIVLERLKYVLIWLEGIYVFHVSIWSIVIDYVFLFSYWSIGSVQAFGCLKMMRLRLSISYCFVWKRFLKTMLCFVKSFNSTLLFTVFMRLIICKVLYKTSERSSTPVAIRNAPNF